MARSSLPALGGGDLPQPSVGLKRLMLALVGLWVLFTVALKWGGADVGLFVALTGSTTALWSGEVWRLLTAPLLHSPDDFWHLVSVLMGLYFLGPVLEERWGSRRLMGFMAVSAVFAYLLQSLVELLVPPAVAQVLSAGSYFGGVPVVEALAVAWALNFRGQTVRLFFALPVSGQWLLGIVVGLSVLRLIALQQAAEGLISPFGGMLCGWLLGGGSPSPIRRLVLKWRYRALARERDQWLATPVRKPAGRGLSVIEGGRSRKSDASKRRPN